MHTVPLPEHSCRVRRKSEALLTRKDEQHISNRSFLRGFREGIHNQVGEYDEQLSAIAALQHTLEECSADLEQALELIAREALQLTRADGCAIAIDVDGSIQCRARAGFLAPPIGATIDPGAGLTGECLRSGEAVRCDDTFSDARVKIDCISIGIRSVVVVPLRKHKQVIGLIAVFSSRTDGFHSQVTGILQLLAGVASQPWTGAASAYSPAGRPDAPIALMEQSAQILEEPSAIRENASTYARDCETRVSAPPAMRWAANRQITKSLDTIRQDLALRVLGHAKAYLTLESLYDGMDRSRAISLFESLMFDRAEQLGVL
jgi:hypothetical protein